MSTPSAPDEHEHEDETPARVEVPTGRTLYGRPVDYVATDPGTAWQWDDRLWRDAP